jgi:hypothetical protein
LCRVKILNANPYTSGTQNLHTLKSRMDNKRALALASQLNTCGLPPEKWSSLRHGFRAIWMDEGMPQKKHKPKEVVAKLRQVDLACCRYRPPAPKVIQ